MRGHVITYSINGHDIEYSRETNGRYVCQSCGGRLLTALEFVTVKCAATEGDRQ